MEAVGIWVGGSGTPQASGGHVTGSWQGDTVETSTFHTESSGPGVTCIVPITIVAFRDPLCSEAELHLEMKAKDDQERSE